MAETDENPRPTGRPAPQYGEYAPEGWAPIHSIEDRPADSAPSGAAAPGPEASGTEPPASSPNGDEAAARPTPGRVPGVPHNLGAAGQAAPVADPQLGTPPQQPAGPGAPVPQPAARGGRGADRIVTVLLLALGALGALNFAAALQQFPMSLETLSRALGAESVVIPDSVSVIGTVGALTVLAVYALNLIFSIQRMRSHKLAFWVPIVAGVVAFLVILAFATVAMSQLPELVQLMSQPDALSKLLAYLGQQGS